MEENEVIITEEVVEETPVVETVEEETSEVESVQAEEVAEEVAEETTEQYNKNMKTGLYANIHAKRDRIEAGSGEKMRKVGTKGAPTAKSFILAKKTAKK